MSFKIREPHWEVLLNFMEKNPNFAAGKFVGAQGKETSRKLWSQLTQELNSLGFGEKSAEKWQKTWTDFKYNIKKKGSHAVTDGLKTGGGPSEGEPFNSFELRALGLLGGRSFYAGLGTKETGQHSQCSNSNTVRPTPPTFSAKKEYKFVVQPSCSKFLEERNENMVTENINPCSTKSKRTIDDDHSYTFTPKKQKKELMDDAYTKTIDLLGDIKETLVNLNETLRTGFTQIAEAISARSTF